MSTADLMEKVAEVAPDKYDFIVKTAEEVRESPFRDEILQELDAIMQKVAAMGPTFGQRVGNAAMGLGAAAATGIAASLAGDMYDALKRGITKSRNYHRMIKENPDLHDLPADQVQKTFATLHRFNPEFSSDPVVAGAYVRRLGNLEAFDPQMLTTMISARKNLKDVKSVPFGRAAWSPMETSDPRASELQDINLRRARLGLEKDISHAAAETAGMPGGPAPTARMRAWARGNSRAYPRK